MTNHIPDAGEMAADHIIKAAKEAGGTTYTNRHHDGTACAFGPEALERFYAIAFAAGMERAAKICDKRGGQFFSESPFSVECHQLSAVIRAEAHAQNQPKNVHDTGNVSKN